MKKFRFDYQEHPYTPKSPHVTPDENQSVLYAAYEKSITELNPDAFMQVLNEPAIKNKISFYSSSISYYFAQLALQFNVESRLTENSQMMNFYFDNIHSIMNYKQATELQHKNLVVFAAQVLYTSSKLQEAELAKKVIDEFIEQDFDLEKETNRAFLFNVACYYAVNHNKPQMLNIISRAIALGRDPKSYLTDSDFTEYREDPDFLSALKPTAVTAP